MSAPTPIRRNTKLLALATMRCRSGAPRLSYDELREHLSVLAGWSLVDNAIEKIFTFANYYETMAFVNAVAYVAHKVDHHPDLMVQYNRCIVRYSTHDAGGITVNDCICASKVESLTV